MSNYDLDFFLESDTTTTEPVKPFHTVNTKDKKELLKWLNASCKAIREAQQAKIRKQREYLEMYMGVHISSRRRRQTSNYLDSKSYKNDKLVINHLYDLTESKVSQFTRIKESPEVLPSSDEHRDKIAAKGAKKVLNHLTMVNQLDYMKQQVHRNKEIMGEAYVVVEWDAFMGDLDPDYVAGKTIQLNEDNSPILDLLGETIKISPLQARIGEVKTRVEYPWRILLQRKSDYNKVEYGFHIVPENIETLKKDYPSKDFKKSESKIYDIEKLETKPLEDEIIVYHFYHKPTKYTPEGFYIKFTDKYILEIQETSKYNHGDFPWQRITSLDIAGRLDGISKYQLLGDIQATNTNIFNLILKNIKMTAHNKWVMPRGAAKYESLGSDNTIVQYNGPVPPQLVSAPSLPPDVFNLLSYTEDQLGKKFAAGQIASGQAPAGITAAVALQFLNEMENDRASSDIAKHNIFMEGLYRKMLSVAGEYYKSDDGRLLRIMGEDNKFLMKYFDQANLTKTYDVVINNGTALPETKAGRVQRVIEMLQFGGEEIVKDLGTERIIDLLDLGNADKMVSLATEAIRTAEAENEIMLNGEGMPLPEEWEDHILHWRTHVQEIQKLSFKVDVDLDIQDKLTDHIKMTELAMADRAARSPEFQAKLATLELYPIFIDAATPVSREQQQAEVQGAANRGEPTAQIAAPAEEINNTNNGGN